MSQVADPSDTSSPSEEETQGNVKGRNLRRSVSDKNHLLHMSHMLKVRDMGPKYLV